MKAIEGRKRSMSVRRGHAPRGLIGTHSAWRRLSLTVGISVIAAAFVFEGTALATATSGDVYKLTTGPYTGLYVDNCLKATISTGADNVADIYSFSDHEPSHCDASYAHSMPGGYIGVDASGYRNGAFCGNTGYYTNSGPTSGIGVGSEICSKPSGSHSYHTVATGEVWDYYYTEWHYAYTGTVASPTQNYS